MFLLVWWFPRRKRGPKRRTNAYANGTRISHIFSLFGVPKCLFLFNSFSWKSQKTTWFIGFSAIRGGAFFDFFKWFYSNLKNTSSGYTEHIEYSCGFYRHSGLGAGPAIGGIRWRFFFCINCRKSWEIVLFHKVFWFLVFNGFAFVFLSALQGGRTPFSCVRK